MLMENSYKKFIACCLGIMLLSLLAAGAVNLVVDPYGVWGLYRQQGFNLWAARGEDKERLVKPLQALAVKPQAVFLGNSQPLAALDTETYERLTGQEAYNYALPGASVYEMRRCLEHMLLCSDRLSSVIVAVNFEQFAANPRHPLDRTQPGFDEAQMDSRHITGENLAKTLLSLEALRDSRETLRLNRDHPYGTEFLVGGRYADVSQDYRNHRLAWQFQTTITKVLALGDYYEGMCLDEDSFRELQRILDLCSAHDLQVQVCIMPMHARAIQMRAPAWDCYEEWLRRLTAMVPVWFFEGYDGLTESDALPGQVEMETNPYYWDTHHPKRQVGDMILTRLCGGESFGRLLTASDVDEALALLRAGRRDWEAAHPESVEEVLYYSGFAPQVPQALAGEMVPKPGVVRLDAPPGGQGLLAELPRSGSLELSGGFLGQAAAPVRIYAVLEDGQGSCYYALAEPAENRAIAAFMYQQADAYAGFRLQAPLRRVEPGLYRLSFVEAAADGGLTASGPLGTVQVR